MKPAPPQQGRRGLGAREPAPAPDLRPAGCFRNVSRSRQHRRNRQPSSVSPPFRPFRDRPGCRRGAFRGSSAECTPAIGWHILNRVLSKNTNELKTGAPGRFDRHRPVASPRSGACRRRCRRFGFSARAGKTPSSNGMPRFRAETWIQARAAPGPERARPATPR